MKVKKLALILVLLVAYGILAAGPVVEGEQIEGGYRNGYSGNETD